MTFADNLLAHKHNIALMLANGESLTYGQLDAKVKLFARSLSTSPSKKLFFLPAYNSLASIISYLACLQKGYAVLLLSPSLAKQNFQKLIDIYQPDGIIETEDLYPQLNSHASNETPLIHEDLALLLSTSGSTGSAKQVRLSYQNIQSNADAIIEYLELDETERAITTLPMHYSYGLSVINSHLAVGASLVLTNDSLVTREFWTLFKQHEVTSFSGVPYTYELLQKLRFNRMDLPSLRYLTQAGGKLNADIVQQFSQTLGGQGKRFYTMYGQTEATARISYLPPNDIKNHPDSIGFAIPGGQLSLDDAKGQTITQANKVGELVYRGDNVMMGYSIDKSDLSLGAELSKLNTGDLAYRDEEGYFYITGRQSRFVKLFGLRVDLDEVEKCLSEQGWQAFCIGNDDTLNIACLENSQVKLITHYVTETMDLHPSSIKVISIDDFPRTDNGKISYSELENLMASLNE